MNNGRDWIDHLLSKDGKRSVEIFTNRIMASDRAVTRGSATDSTVGCRWWQLVYAILVSLPYPPSILLTWNKGINSPNEWRVYQEMIEVVRAVVQQIKTYTRSTLFKILYENQVIECTANTEGPCLRQIDSSFFNEARPDGRYYMCLYGDKFIGHYFVLEKRRGDWYISSSYGSEWVRVPVQTKEVTKEELEQFVWAIATRYPQNQQNQQNQQKNRNINEEKGQNRDTNQEAHHVIEQFYSKYFLVGGLTTRYSENEPKRLRHKSIPTQKGVSEELKIVLRGPLRIGYIESMEEYIRQIVKYETEMKVNTVTGGLVNKQKIRRRGTLRRIGIRRRKGTQRTRRNRRLNRTG